MVHSSPSTVQVQHPTIENANNCSEEWGQPNHHKQDDQYRGPFPESLRVEDNIAELNCGIGTDTLENCQQMQSNWNKTLFLYEPKGKSVTKH